MAMIINVCSLPCTAVLMGLILLTGGIGICGVGRSRLNRLLLAYRIALKKSNDLFMEIDLDKDSFIDHSEKRDAQVWNDMPDSYSGFVKKGHELCVPEYKTAFIETFSPRSLKERMQKERQLVSLEYKVRYGTDDYKWYHAVLVPVSEKRGRTSKVICLETDITRRMRKQEILKNSAAFDGLTGVNNRVTAESLVKNYLEGQGDQGNHAFLMIDLDDFKKINDNYGHAIGDAVLSRMGQALRSAFRETDIVGRLGGDEFAVLMTNYRSRKDIRTKVQIISKEFERICYEEKLVDQNYISSMSVGVALYKEDGDNFENLYYRADVALYYLKRHGKNGCMFYGEMKDEKEKAVHGKNRQ